MKALVAGVLLLAQESGYVPARFLDGNPPGLPPLASNGGLVALELLIAPSGIVQEVRVIDDAPPFTQEMKNVISLWRFEPATSDGSSIASRVAVVGLFRAPTLIGGAPPPPSRLHDPSPEVPYPIEVSTPAFPPQALYEGLVLFEVEVDEEGGVSNAELLRETGGFAAASNEALRKFRFQPAERDGRPVVSYALVFFGFPQPLGPPKIRR